jgi:hypothetical protein
MYVEWLRSCYVSRWRVWNDSTESVAGRYYRVAQDQHGKPLVPAYPFPHIYGSREWWDRNFQLEQPALGEVLNQSHTWNAGTAPVEVPRNVFVGDPACIDGGEPIALGLERLDGERYLSWPAACIVADPLDDWGWAAAVYRCEVQAWWADRMQEADTGFIGAAQAAFEARFPGSVVTRFDGTTLFPPLWTIVHPLYAVVMYQPTQNMEQALIEVLTGVLPPTNFGAFGTTSLWFRAGQRGLIRLGNQGVGLDTPLLCVGYSYGGCAAATAAAQARVANKERTIHLLSFGSPRPGDFRLRGLVALPTVAVAVANDDDAYTAIPPSLDNLLPVEGILARNLLPFAQWQKVDETWVQFADGHVVRNGTPTLSSQELIDLLELVWTTGTLFGYPAHKIQEYARRLRLRCPRAPALANGMVGFRFGLGPMLGLRPPELALVGSLGLGDLRVAGGGLGLGELPVAGGGLGLGELPLPHLAGGLGLLPTAAATGSLGLQRGGLPNGVCPGELIPATLKLTITGSDFGDGTYRLNFANAVGTTWNFALFAPIGLCTAAGNFITFQIGKTSPAIRMLCKRVVGAAVNTYTPTSVSCGPFSALFNNAPPIPECASSNPYTAVVSEW